MTIINNKYDEKEVKNAIEKALSGIIDEYKLQFFGKCKECLSENNK